MEWDEPKAKQQSSAHQVGEPLDKLSMDELHARVEMLEKEIERLRGEVVRKRAHEAAASELFTGKG